MQVRIVNGSPLAIERRSDGVNAADTTQLLAALAARRTALDAALAGLAERVDTLAAIAALLTDALRSGHKALLAGNGGSAAEAQHFAGELVGRFRRERQPWAVLALTTDTTILTAVGNDYGFAEVFARQVRAFGQPGDVFYAISTSGESENLLRAADAAHERGLTVVATTGARDCRLARAADLCLPVAATDMPVTQEAQMIVTHLLCELVEERLAAPAAVVV